ncbi:MAG: hypothetical protein IT302_06825 [Dehalococcoidia bacterium]|nr:hypothetical protein [Dehalococcoidia bacterium]
MTQQAATSREVQYGSVRVKVWQSRDLAEDAAREVEQERRELGLDSERCLPRKASMEAATTL